MSRRGENLLVTLVIPLVLLLFFGSTGVLATGGVDFLVPGILALAIMSTGMVSLGIATAYERHYGVLKRLGGSPLTRPQLIAAKSVAFTPADKAVRANIRLALDHYYGALTDVVLPPGGVFSFNSTLGVRPQRRY